MRTGCKDHVVWRGPRFRLPRTWSKLGIYFRQRVIGMKRAALCYVSAK